MRNPFIMRTILSVCFLLILRAGYSQIADSFYIQITQVFENMETNRVSTGLLRDYGLDFTNVEIFDGVQLSDSNFVYSGTWFDLYTSLYTYRFNNTALSVLFPDSAFKKIDSLRGNGYIPLSLLLFKYDQLREDAVTNNLITVTGDKLYDKYVNGVWQDPYEQKIFLP